MNNIGKLTITTPSDRELVMVREFNAPRHLVFDCWTKPELLRRWLGVLGGWEMPVCEIDLRVGGSYRYLWRGPDGAEMGMGGVYREIAAPERLLSTEVFDEAWYPGEAIDTLELTEADGTTTSTLTVLYDSKEARDMGVSSVDGVAQGFDKLEELLASMPRA